MKFFDKPKERWYHILQIILFHATKSQPTMWLTRNPVTVGMPDSANLLERSTRPKIILYKREQQVSQIYLTPST